MSNILKVLKELNAVITDGHLVLTSGRHSQSYINLRAVAPFPGLLERASMNMVGTMPITTVPDIYVGPETLGRTLAAFMALGHYPSRLALWCNVVDNHDGKVASWPAKMGFETHLKPGMTAIVVDDLLTTGSSVIPVIELLREADVEVLGVAVVVRRNPGVTAETLGVPNLWVLEDVYGGQTWSPEDCPLCKAERPLTLRPGHGWQFAERNPDHPSVIATKKALTP